MVRFEAPPPPSVLKLILNFFFSSDSLLTFHVSKSTTKSPFFPFSFNSGFSSLPFVTKLLWAFFFSGCLRNPSKIFPSDASSVSELIFPLQWAPLLFVFFFLGEHFGSTIYNDPVFFLLGFHLFRIKPPTHVSGYVFVKWPTPSQNRESSSVKTLAPLFFPLLLGCSEASVSVRVHFQARCISFGDSPDIAIFFGLFPFSPKRQ